MGTQLRVLKFFRELTLCLVLPSMAYGPSGAAALLGLNPTTLTSRMKGSVRTQRKALNFFLWCRREEQREV